MIGAHTLQSKKRDNRKRPMREYKKGDIANDFANDFTLLFGVLG